MLMNKHDFDSFHFEHVYEMKLTNEKNEGGFYQLHIL